ncbi:Cna B-type domain-containing protein [Peptoniphilus sp. KCTC 25270]|uniref:Cna B-type domain-containing protein n=1 Tax=Peptoniphilus sp. KCTC 25270 TaxID=2897414 RepID=UPI001E3E46AF|nr:Cna B-type domain-containing protein [Peptoniphilus sp. KCTC 25270]MCD1146548.1 Cna B-type domain-containing protein [Peptoniphilus sp. KCTC 25270]
MRKILISLFVMVLFLFSNPAYAAEPEEATGASVAPAAVEAETGVEKRDVASDTDISVGKVVELTLDETLQFGEETIQPKEDDALQPDEAETIPLETENAADKIGVGVEKQLMKNNESVASEENGLTVPQTDPMKEKVEEKSDKIAIEDEEVTLKEGTTLDAKILSETPVILGGNSEGLVDSATPTVEVLVSSFEELKAAIENAPEGQATTIVIDTSFELVEKLTIKKGQNIILTAKNIRLEEDKHSWEKPWSPITQPADVAEQGEEKQREVIEEAVGRGEEAIQEADVPLPDENKGDIIIKRAKEFVKDSLFNVLGKLTLGTEDSAIYIDGNSDVQTALDDRGTVINVDNGGQLTMKNAVIMNSKNGHGYTGPIKVKKGGSFTMDGGRISSNTSYEKIDPDYNRPTSAGAVYVDLGANFTMNNGLIDNNNGGMTGGVFAGSLFGSSGDPAIVEINGGIIANNKSNTRFQSGGGVTAYPKAKLTIKDGIIAGNRSGSGGGVAVSDQFISEFSNIVNREYANTPADYEKHLKENKAEANLNGGLIYKNVASNVGGGVYVDSNHVNFNKTMILDNSAGNFGGGIYVSFPPRVQDLENLLVTENSAKATWVDSFGGGNGGGLWNCPTGYVHIGDGHSVYVFNNASDSFGKDLTFSKKTGYFKLNGVNIKDIFYSHVSPVTKEGNIIKFLEDGEEGVDIPKEMSFTNDVVHLRAVYDAILQKEAWKNAQTFILGNTARNGGGIGSNANLQTPNDEGEYGLKIKKKWDGSIDTDAFDSNKTVKADIFIVPVDKDEAYVRLHYGIDPNVYKYGEIELSKKNNWESFFHTQGGSFSPDLVEKFPAIKGWDFAYNKDKGLPFTAEELKARGLKYLVVEQGNEFFSIVEEIPEKKDAQVEAGAVKITRIESEDYGEYASSKQDIYLFYYDQEANKGLGRLELLTKEELNDENNHTAIFRDPGLLDIDTIEYYGEDLRLMEWGKDWYESDLRGFEITDRGNAFVLVEKDGKKTLLVPYLWTMYDKKSGYFAEIVDSTNEMIDLAGNPHTFEITNYPRTDLPVEKVWKLDEADEKNIPDSVKVYLLLDNKRILIGYEKDKDGNYLKDAQGNFIPIYQSLVLKKADGWKGKFDNVNPIALVNNRYSIEEEENGYLPFFYLQENGKISFRIGFKKNYHEIGDPQGYSKAITDAFHDFVGDVTLHLHIRIPNQDEKVLTQKYTWRQINNPLYPDYSDNEYIMEMDRDHASFDNISLDLKGMNLRVEYYDAPETKLGLTDYHFYLQQDEQGFYTLYMPSVMIHGVPYGQFELEDFKHEEKDAFIGKVENYPGPHHDIDIEKIWHGDEEGDRPETLKITIRDKSGKVQEIFLKEGDDWKASLQGLQGKLNAKDYELVEEAIDKYRSEKATSVQLKLLRKVKEGESLLPIKLYLDGKEVEDAVIYSTIDRSEVRIDSQILSDILLKGNYKYKLYKSQEETEQAVRIIKNEDGSYLIEVPVDITMAEVLDVKFNNFYTPVTPPDVPEEPPVTPPDVPEEPPVTPPDVPEEPPITPPDVPEEPPVTPPDVPEEPPVTPPDVPEEPPVTPPDVPEEVSRRQPKTPQTGPPKTFDPGIAGYAFTSIISILVLAILGFEGKKKRM